MTHFTHKGQPRSNGADDEAGIPGLFLKEGRRGGQGEPNKLLCTCNWKTKLHLPGSSSALARPLPALRLPRPIPSRPGAYIRAKWSRREQSVEVARARRWAWGSSLLQLAAAAPRFLPHLSCPAGAHPVPPPPVDLQTEAQSGFALGAFTSLAEGFPAGFPGVTGRDEQRRKEARSCVRAWCSLNARRRDALAGVHDVLGARPWARECGRWGTGASEFARDLRGSQDCQRFGPRWTVGNGVGGSGTPNVDYLVHIARAWKTHHLVSTRGLMPSAEQVAYLEVSFPAIPGKGSDWTASLFGRS